MKVSAKLVREAGGAEQYALASGPATEYKKILKKVLTQELNSVIIKSEAEEESEKSPTHLYHLLGQRKALRTVLSLLDDNE